MELHLFRAQGVENAPDIRHFVVGNVHDVDHGFISQIDFWRQCRFMNKMRVFMLIIRSKSDNLHGLNAND